jgi:type I restriction enzyme M protein
MARYKKEEKKNIKGAELKAPDKMIKDVLTGEWITRKPEEEVRQLFIKKLIKEYKYPKEHIKKEVTVQIGRQKKRADIIVFKDDKNFNPAENAYIVVEVKAKDEKGGRDQLYSYLNATTAEFGVWFNGKDAPVFLEQTRKPHTHIDIPDIPPFGKTLADVGLYKKKDLIPATELKTVFENIHNYVYANEGYLKEKVFNEVLKLIFIKMVDELSPSPDCEFRITNQEMEEVEKGGGQDFKKRIDNIFRKVINTYPAIFDLSEKIELQTPTLAYVVGQLQKYNFRHTKVDIKGEAFQTFVHAHLRGERGEFFTPSPVIKMVVEMLDPKDNESVLDPACGSGGFLIKTMNHVRETYREKRPDMSESEIDKAVGSYADSYIKGIDFNPDLARVAKMYMVLNEDGHRGIFSVNSLVDFKQIEDISQGKVKEAKFDLILTNPPFGAKGKVTDGKVLENYELGYKWKRQDDKWIKTDKLMSKGSGKGGQVPDILFIERCWQFLKEGGRMAIVLPDGDLTNTTLGYVRQWIKDNARILAVISLPPETFVPYGAGVKASVLFLQKLSKKELDKIKKKDYPIFMGIVEKIGYDIRGREVYKRNEKGEVVKDEKEEPVVDEDVNKIVGEFKKLMRNII